MTIEERLSERALNDLRDALGIVQEPKFTDAMLEAARRRLARSERINRELRDA